MAEHSKAVPREEPLFISLVVVQVNHYADERYEAGLVSIGGPLVGHLAEVGLMLRGVAENLIPPEDGLLLPRKGLKLV